MDEQADESEGSDGNGKREGQVRKKVRFRTRVEVRTRLREGVGRRTVNTWATAANPAFC